ncbi:MAG: 1-(5-phosphoribosyl)-5-[(5-phosphoribosylamino)methylideneamino]imidazole-4-carboxamide isomerase [Butyrivibrio sp.]|nr:1-(5-phosphoribosyl)-5-[(5-phosphoribosylamino)methylideneamino]imidazole-4-carboxamide isomerase [Butyrivibrio sp.]
MKLYPAIDMKDGKCVRLKQGEFKDITVYCDEPWKVARYFEENGASFIHLVDLDGALKGHSVNEESIKRIVSEVNIPCELGGGIRTVRDIERVLSYGINRVIIGTKAVSSPEFVREAVEKFGSEKIVIGVDAKDGFVAVEGWEQLSDKTALSMCLTMKELGVKHIVYTDISKDGMLAGPNVAMTKKLTDETGLDIIASGGVSGAEDLRSLAAAGIKGAIIGKAIYENRINIRDAVREFENQC